MKKPLILSGVLAFAFIFIGGLIATPVSAEKPDTAGFDQFGYNYGARLFNGSADGVDKNLDGKVWGSPTYANDRVVMKWNAAWDACNAAGYDDPDVCAGAWLDNEWNGKAKDGSGEVWHYKIIWVGSEAEQSPYWKDGGYSIWGNYEVIMDQGTVEGVHTWYAHGIPNGYGAE